MSVTAILLIIGSALMHASWNYVSKRQNPSLAFFWMAALGGAVLMSPLFVVYGRVLPAIPTTVWGLVLVTGMAQTVYMFGLAGAYRRGDISLAYPLARALPVLFIAGISLLLGNGKDIRTISLVGMGLIAVGCIMLPFPSFQKVKLGDYFDAVYLMALLAAIGTTGYTMIDDRAMRLMRETSAIGLTTTAVTILFIALQVSSTALMLGIATVLYPPERRQLGLLLQNRSLVVTGMLTGVVIMATYGLALAAMAYVTNVSYVAAFRQLSIPIGAVMGMAWQNEPRFLPKLLGIGVVSVGLILVGVG